MTGIGGALAVFWLSGSLNSIYALMAAGLVLYGVGSALSVYFANWRE